MQINIILDSSNNTYYAGQFISGLVYLTIDSAIKIHGVKYRIVGAANTSISDYDLYKYKKNRRRKQSKKFSSHEIYFKNEYFLIGSEISQITLNKGTHTYGFNYRLKNKIPSSFKGDYGHIKYFIKVTVIGISQILKEFELEFIVISPVDLNINPRIQEPYQFEIYKDFPTLCCTSGDLSLSLTGILPKTGYVPGEIIPILLTFNTTRNVKINELNIKLIMVLTYFVDQPKFHTKICNSLITELVLDKNIESLNKTTEIKIPLTIKSNLQFCNIIKLEYQLILSVIPSTGDLTALTKTIPILIGTIPLISNNEKVPTFNDFLKIIPSNDFSNIKSNIGWNVP